MKKYAPAAIAAARSVSATTAGQRFRAGGAAMGTAGGAAGLGSVLGAVLLGRARLFHGADEPIAPSRHCLYITRLFRAIGQRSANLVDGEIDSMLEVDESGILP